ncbi:MAG TPA: ATP-binding protein [Gemmatimonadales bacterium]|nr:ATP-binding protein [Gemmatimonadales bacterium]
MKSSFRWGLACLVLLFVSLAAPAAAQVRRVVLLYDERTDLPGLAKLDARLVRTLRAGLGGVEVYREAMDLSRFRSDRYPLLLKDYLRGKYAGKRIDVVIAALGPALDFMLAYGPEVYPGASIVFCGIDRRELGARRLPANVTGVLLKREFAPTLELALRLHPGTQRVVLVGGSSNFDHRLVHQAKAEFQAAPRQAQIKYLIGLPWPDLLDTLARLPPRTVVLYSTMFADGTGRAFVPHEAVEQIARTADAPVYAFVDQYLGLGIVGGHLYSLDAHGEAAARLALRLLAGTPASAVPPVERPASIDMFDWRQVSRWGIDEHRLPAGAVVRYRELSLWERHRTTILAILGVLLLQSALIFWLLIERRVRRRTQAALQESEARAAEQRLELAHLGRVALVGELSATLAHEMKQPLTAILVNARAAQHLLKADGAATPELGAILEEIAADDRRAAEVIDHVHSLVKKEGAEPQLLSTNEVVSEVVELVRTDLQHRGVVVSTRLCEPAPLVLGDRVQLQQVFLNLVMNACDAMSHTPPGERLLVVSTATHGDARIEVRDRGRGIAPDALERVFEPFVTTKRDGLGLGLAICRSILTAHGGHIRAVNNPERGATFVVSLPLAADRRAAFSHGRLSQAIQDRGLG